MESQGKRSHWAPVAVLTGIPLPTVPPHAVVFRLTFLSRTVGDG